MYDYNISSNTSLDELSDKADNERLVQINLFISLYNNYSEYTIE